MVIITKTQKNSKINHRPRPNDLTKFNLKIKEYAVDNGPPKNKMNGKKKPVLFPAPSETVHGPPKNRSILSFFLSSFFL